MRLDAIHIAMLRILERDGRRPVSEIAREVGLTDNAVRYRLRRLQEEGIVRRFTVHVDPGRLGRASTAVVLLRLQPGTDIRPLRELPNIVCALATQGEFQATILVIAEDDVALARFLAQNVASFPGVVGHSILSVKDGADLAVTPSVCSGEDRRN